MKFFTVILQLINCYNLLKIFFAPKILQYFKEEIFTKDNPLSIFQ